MTIAADDRTLPELPPAERTAVERRDRMFGWLIASPSLAVLFLVVLFPVFC